MFKLVIDSFLRPRETIQTVLALGFDQRTLFQAALLISCAYGIAQPVFTSLSEPGAPRPFLDDPVLVALAQFVTILLCAGAVSWIGRAFGGTGAFHGSLTISVWYTVVGVLPQMALLFLQAMGSQVAMIQVGLFAWLLVIFAIFVQTLHGFENLFLTLIGVIGSGILFMALIFFVFISLGVIRPETL